MPQPLLKSMIFGNLSKAVVLLFVALLFACGSSATPQSDGGSTPATAAPEATAVPKEPAASAPKATAVPTPAVQATKAPPAKVKPTGRIK